MHPVSRAAWRRGLGATVYELLMGHPPHCGDAQGTARPVSCGVWRGAAAICSSRQGCPTRRSVVLRSQVLGRVIPHVFNGHLPALNPPPGLGLPPALAGYLGLVQQ